MGTIETITCSTGQRSGIKNITNLSVIDKFIHWILSVTDITSFLELSLLDKYEHPEQEKLVLAEIKANNI